MMDILNPPDILLKSISINEQNNGPEKEVYFYHGDHLGSANWITDYTGAPIQYIHYAPYGELIDNQVLYGYDERYKFTGKERDAETGYDFFGARFYWQAGTWLSVDPLADENPSKSPYMYCSWNPISRIVQDGRDVTLAGANRSSVTIGTARDIGNFAAGFLAASNGITGRTTRTVFDVFQNLTTAGCTTGEPPVSWWAQQLGHDYGRASRIVNRVCQPNIYNAYR